MREWIEWEIGFLIRMRMGGMGGMGGMGIRMRMDLNERLDFW